MVGAAYFDQFNVVRVIGIGTGAVFTNFAMMIGAAIGVLWLLSGGRGLIPNRWQSGIELIYLGIRAMVVENLGGLGQRYLPIVICLFGLIAGGNILGLFPYVFTPTAHIAMTMGLSVSIIIGVVLLGLIKNGGVFLSILMPGGVPLVLAPFLVLIETLSFATRGVSLGVRLAANISAGHILFGILSGFVCDLWLGGLGGLSVLAVGIMAFVTLLEIMVAIIQGYVFCLLTTIYVKDTMIGGEKGDLPMA